MAKAQGRPVRERSAVSGDFTHVVRSGPSVPTPARGNAKVTPSPRSQPSVNLLGSTATASPAESFALNGSLAYVCDDNEISVIDVSTPASPPFKAKEDRNSTRLN